MWIQSCNGGSSTCASKCSASFGVKKAWRPFNFSEAEVPPLTQKTNQTPSGNLSQYKREASLQVKSWLVTSHDGHWKADVQFDDLVVNCRWFDHLTKWHSHHSVSNERPRTAVRTRQVITADVLTWVYRISFSLQGTCPDI